MGNSENSSGMLTFSVNGQNRMTTEKAKKVIALIHGMNEYNLEFAGEAFIQIVEGKTMLYDGEDALDDLNTFAYFRRKEEQIELATRAETECTLINEQELEMGKTGAVAELIEDKDLNVETLAIDNVDGSHYVERFLDIREELFFSKGYDIYRLLTLALDDDKQAVRKTSWLFRECGLLDFLEDFFAVPANWENVRKILG